MNKPYHFEFPIHGFNPKLPTQVSEGKCTCEPYATIEECVRACKLDVGSCSGLFI